MTLRHPVEAHTTVPPQNLTWMSPSTYANSTSICTTGSVKILKNTMMRMGQQRDRSLKGMQHTCIYLSQAWQTRTRYITSRPSRLHEYVQKTQLVRSLTILTTNVNESWSSRLCTKKSITIKAVEYVFYRTGSRQYRLIIAIEQCSIPSETYGADSSRQNCPCRRVRAGKFPKIFRKDESQNMQAIAKGQLNSTRILKKNGTPLQKIIKSKCVGGAWVNSTFIVNSFLFEIITINNDSSQEIFDQDLYHSIGNDHLSLSTSLIFRQDILMITNIRQIKYCLGQHVTLNYFYILLFLIKNNFINIMNEQYIEEQCFNLFRQSELYHFYKMMQTTGLTWLIDWYRTPFRHIKIKNTQQFDEFLEKIGVQKNYSERLAGYGFYSYNQNKNVLIIRHNQLKQQSNQEEWLNVWIQLEEQKFLEGGSFLKRLYFTAVVEKQEYLVRWSKNGGQLIFREFQRTRRFMKVVGDMKAMLNYYGFTGACIRYRHPFITLHSPLKAWLLTELMAGGSQKVNQIQNTKLLGIEPQAVRVEYKPKGVDMEYKLERQKLKSMRNSEQNNRNESPKHKNVPRFQPFYQPIIQPFYQTVLKKSDNSLQSPGSKQPFLKLVNWKQTNKNRLLQPNKIGKETKYKQTLENQNSQSRKKQNFTSIIELKAEYNVTNKLMTQPSALFKTPTILRPKQVQQQIKTLSEELKSEVVRIYENKGFEDINALKIIAYCNQIIAEVWVRDHKDPVL